MKSLWTTPFSQTLFPVRSSILLGVIMSALGWMSTVSFLHVLAVGKNIFQLLTFHFCTAIKLKQVLSVIKKIKIKKSLNIGVTLSYRK